MLDKDAGLSELIYKGSATRVRSYIGLYFDLSVHLQETDTFFELGSSRVVIHFHVFRQKMIILQGMSRL